MGQFSVALLGVLMNMRLSELWGTS